MPEPRKSKIGDVAIRRLVRNIKWWGKQDSNLRRLSQRIYSPPPLPLGTFPHLGSNDATTPDRTNRPGPGAAWFYGRKAAPVNRKNRLPCFILPPQGMAHRIVLVHNAALGCACGLRTRYLDRHHERRRQAFRFQQAFFQAAIPGSRRRWPSWRAGWSGAAQAGWRQPGHKAAHAA